MRDSEDDITQHSINTKLFDEQQLIARLRASDEQALSELIHLYASPLVQLVTSMLNSHDVAQDVVQDVFCWVWDKRAELNIQDGVFGYLCRAVRNRACNVLRSERSQSRLKNTTLSLYSGAIPSTRNLAEASIAEVELQAAIDAALGTLQGRTREIFLLHVDHNLTYAEISKALEITIPTVRMQMYRATRHLWKQLKEWM